MLVLVVENDVRVAQFLRRGLEEEGWTVDVCTNGEDALQQGLAQPYAIVLLDWGLPGADGLYLVRQWRERGQTTPVLMITARSGVEATVLALDSGVDDFLTKPFRFEELLARMRALLRRSQGGGSDQAGGTVELGDCRIDLRRRVVERSGREEPLSAREFALLDLLLRHRGEVLSRSRILDRVWGLSSDPTTNVVDVYVRYLRVKLDPPGAAHSHIETVRGQGYRLRPAEESP
jgi:two-component system OmpR family response regulator